MSSSYHWHLPPASSGNAVVKMPWKTSSMTTTTTTAGMGATTTVRHHGSNENLGKYLNSNFLIKWKSANTRIPFQTNAEHEGGAAASEEWKERVCVHCPAGAGALVVCSQSKLCREIGEREKGYSANVKWRMQFFATVRDFSRDWIIKWIGRGTDFSLLLLLLVGKTLKWLN